MTAAPSEACELDVVQYGYLMHAEPPRFGQEFDERGQTGHWPLAWSADLAAKVKLDLVASTYRIVDEQGREFGAATALANVVTRGEGGYVWSLPVTAETHPGLVSYSGKLKIELVLRDWAGRQATGTLCWRHRVLAPPLQIGEWRAVPMERSLAAAMERGALPLYETTVVQGTSAPVVLTLPLSQLELQATRTIRHFRTVQSRDVAEYQCEGPCDAVATAPLDSSEGPHVSRIPLQLRVELLGEAQSLECAVVGNAAQCVVPPREQAARHFTLRVSTCEACTLGSLNPFGQAARATRAGTGIESYESGCTKQRTAHLPAHVCERFEDDSHCTTYYCRGEGSATTYKVLTNVTLTAFSAGGSAAPDLSISTAVQGGTASLVKPAAVAWQWQGQ